MDLPLEKPRGQAVMEINVVCLSTKTLARQSSPALMSMRAQACFWGQIIPGWWTDKCSASAGSSLIPNFLTSSLLFGWVTSQTTAACGCFPSPETRICLFLCADENEPNCTEHWQWLIPHRARRMFPNGLKCRSSSGTELQKQPSKEKLCVWGLFPFSFRHDKKAAQQNNLYTGWNGSLT